MGEHSYTKLASKKMKDSLSSFLPGLPGVIDTPGSQDNSSLRGLIEKPPVCGKELLLLNQLQLAGFRLHPGPLPEQYRTLLNQVGSSKEKKAKNKKNKTRDKSRVWGCPRELFNVSMLPQFGEHIIIQTCRKAKSEKKPKEDWEFACTGLDCIKDIIPFSAKHFSNKQNLVTE